MEILLDSLEILRRSRTIFVGFISKFTVGLFFFLFIYGVSMAAVPEAPGETRFRFGPFFEYRSENGTNTFFAIRPFFSREVKEKTAEKNMEVVWPLSHFGWRGNYHYGRVLMTFYHKSDLNDPLSPWSISVPPIWSSGRDKDNGFYWGLFPVYGRLPRFFLLEDFHWTMFPLYLAYETGGSHGVRRQYFGWPFFSLKHDLDKTRWSLWPIYGTKSEREVDSRFAFWPIWTERVYHSSVKNGNARMLFPFFEHVKSDTENGIGLLPPFFFRSETTQGAYMLRAPWPFFERYRDKNESTWKSWRFWGMTERGSRHGWWFLHPIVLHREQKTKNLETLENRVWPFFSHEYKRVSDVRGNWRTQSSYFRIWPFFSRSYDENEGECSKSLVLFPVRDVPSVERNWSPFWTFYQCDTPSASEFSYHELFWGLIKWRTRQREE